MAVGKVNISNERAIKAGDNINLLATTGRYLQGSPALGTRNTTYYHQADNEGNLYVYPIYDSTFFKYDNYGDLILSASSGFSGTNAKTPIERAVYGNYVFWSYENDRYIYTVDKNTLVRKGLIYSGTTSSYVVGMANHRNGYTVILFTFNKELIRIDINQETGQGTTVWTNSTFYTASTSPGRVTILVNDNYVYTNKTNFSLCKIDLNTGLVVGDGITISGPPNFTTPNTIDIDSDNNLYIAYENNNKYINAKYDSDINLVWEFTKTSDRHNVFCSQSDNVYFGLQKINKATGLDDGPSYKTGNRVINASPEGSAWVKDDDNAFRYLATVVSVGNQKL